MTMKEADEAAWKFLPVMYDGVEYERITRTGYHYDTRNGRNGFVELLDKNQNSVINVKPEFVTLKQ